MNLKTVSGKSVFPVGIGTWEISSKFEADPSAKYEGAQAVRGNEKAEIDALRYSLQKGQNHIDDNVKSIDVKLTDEEIAELERV